MTNADYLTAIKELVEAIPNEEILAIRVPVYVAIQEAENLYHWSKIDQAAFIGIGFTAEKLEELNVRSGACREAQSLWITNHRVVKDAQKKWNDDSPVAFDLRDELIHTFRFAFFGKKQLLDRVSEIAEGNSNADMIQDLNDLSILGKQYLDLLNAVHFDVSKLDLAATLSSEMADTLAIANGTKQIDDESKLLRDKAYTYLKQLVDQVRAAGKYLFWKNPERLDGYSSEYYRKKRANSKKEDQPEVEA